MVVDDEEGVVGEGVRELRVVEDLVLNIVDAGRLGLTPLDGAVVDEVVGALKVADLEAARVGGELLLLFLPSFESSTTIEAPLTVEN